MSAPAATGPAPKAAAHVRDSKSRLAAPGASRPPAPGSRFPIPADSRYDPPCAISTTTSSPTGLRRQPAGGVPRRPRPDRAADADDDPRDELLREHVHAAGRDAGHRCPDAHLHAGRGTADGGAPDDRQHLRAGGRRRDRRRPRPASCSAWASGRRRWRSTWADGALSICVDGPGPPEFRAPGVAAAPTSCARSGSIRRRRCAPACPLKRCRAACRSSMCRSPRAPPWMPRSPTLRRCGALRVRSPAGTSACSCSALEPASDEVTVYSRMFAPDRAWPRTPRPAAPADRSAVTSWAMACARERLATWSACRAWRWDARAAFTCASRDGPAAITRVQVGGSSQVKGAGSAV